MSEIKINEDQFLGKQELNRFKKFLSREGYQKMVQQIAGSYGIINIPSDVNFDNLRIVQGSTPIFFNLKAGLAIDGNANIITNPIDAINIITTPTDNVFRNVLISYDTTNIEVGTVDINTDGTLSGNGTLFTEVLRGQPNFPVKIVFTNSAFNLQEYEVLSVTDDVTSKIIGASFTPEFALSYVVVGTFTPGKSIPSPNKNIYIYDSYSLVLTASSPTSNQYILAQVKSDGITTVIVDKRSTNLFTLANNDDFTSDLLTVTNGLIGLETLKYDTYVAAKDMNLARIGWGLRSTNTNWSVDVTNNKITITSGFGGIFTSTVGITAGMFDGWRVYFDNGRFARVLTHTMSGTDVILNLKFFDSGRFLTSGNIAVVPDSEEIELSFQGTNANANASFTIPIERGYAEVRIPAGDFIQAKYRNNNNGNTSDFQLLNDGTYINETSFDIHGVLTSPVFSTITTGIFGSTLSVSDNFYQNKADKNKNNHFSATNSFNKMIAIKKVATPVNISLSPTALNKSLVLPNSGNVFLITDTTPYGILEKIVPPNDFAVGEAIVLWLQFVNPVVLKNNVAVNLSDYSLSYYSIITLSATDSNINANDIVQFMLFGDQWVVTNIFRTQDVLDPLSLQAHPITIPDLSCIVPADNTLGSLLQAIINTLCSMTTENRYAFIANKTVDSSSTVFPAELSCPQDTTLVVGSPLPGSMQMITFNDDLNAPYFDNGNDFYMSKYITPNSVLAKQKFIAENMKIKAGISNITGFSVRIIKLDSSDNYVSTLAQTPTVNVNSGTDYYVPVLATPYVTLVEGERIGVITTNTTSSQTLANIYQDARFSNSFE